MDTATIWSLTGIVVPALAALAFGLAAMTPPSFGAARVCFWLAAVALYAGGGVWLAVMPRSHTNSSIALAACVTAGVGLMACLRWLQGREHAANPPRPDTTNAQREWSVNFHGRVADIKVFADTLARYAIAEDVTIVNRSTNPVTISAQLGIQWAHEMMHRILDARQLPPPAWDSILLAFGFSPKQHLLFPFTLGGRQTVTGHVVFDVPQEGAGVAMLASMHIGGLGEDLEGTNYNRNCYLRFSNDAVFGEEILAEVHTVYAPQLDGSGISRQSDLAVAGSAAVWVPR